MDISTRREEGVTIIELNGKLTIGDGDVALREAVNERLQNGDRQLLLNLRQVKMMDSSGLGELIHCKQTAEADGAKIKLLHVEDKVSEVLEMTRLIGVFDTFDDEIDAIASFR